jgi:hypothetical protein
VTQAQKLVVEVFDSCRGLKRFARGVAYADSSKHINIDIDLYLNRPFKGPQQALPLLQ